MKPTHRAFAVTTSLPISLAIGAPPETAITIVGSSYVCAMLPDRIEKIFGLGMDKHRTVTHYLVNAALMGASMGAVVFGIFYGMHELALHHMPGTQGMKIAEMLYQASEGYGILIGIGGIIGSVSHPIIDACTRGGVPLLGPFKKKTYWLVPERYRVRVGEEIITLSGKKRFVMTAGERRWYIGLYTVIFLILFVYFYPSIDFEEFNL